MPAIIKKVYESLGCSIVAQWATNLITTEKISQSNPENLYISSLSFNRW